MNMHLKMQNSLKVFGIILFILIIPLMWLSDEAALAVDDENDPKPVTSSETASEFSSQTAHSFSKTSSSTSPQVSLSNEIVSNPTTHLYLPVLSIQYMNELEEAVLNIVNEERANAGCGPVQAERSLHQAARLHSQDMADNNYFSHTGLNGSRFSDRARAAGYQGFPAGENIAAGYNSAQSVMAGWMSSSGHRRNILNCRHTHIGIGQADNSNSRYRRYWTQVFGQE